MAFIKNLTVSEAKPVSEEEALLEAKSWGYSTVEEFTAAMDAAYEQAEQEAAAT